MVRLEHEIPNEPKINVGDVGTIVESLEGKDAYLVEFTKKDEFVDVVFLRGQDISLVKPYVPSPFATPPEPRGRQTRPLTLSNRQRGQYAKQNLASRLKEIKESRS